uniref:Coiled-coil domain containing 61 n=1 Tax=Monodelphis domestica TaxID=13616 RepID=F7E0C0_MONDO
MDQPSGLQVDYTFRGVEHVVRLAVSGEVLELEVEDRLTTDQWRGEFDSAFIEDLTHKTGNFKQFSIFCSMLESALMQRAGPVQARVCRLPGDLGEGLGGGRGALGGRSSSRACLPVSTGGGPHLQDRCLSPERSSGGPCLRRGACPGAECPPAPHPRKAAGVAGLPGPLHPRQVCVPASCLCLCLFCPPPALGVPGPVQGSFGWGGKLGWKWATAGLHHPCR